MSVVSSVVVVAAPLTFTLLIVTVLMVLVCVMVVMLVVKVVLCRVGATVGLRLSWVALCVAPVVTMFGGILVGLMLMLILMILILMLSACVTIADVVLFEVKPCSTLCAIVCGQVEILVLVTLRLLVKSSRCMWLTCGVRAFRTVVTWMVRLLSCLSVLVGTAPWVSVLRGACRRFTLSGLALGE